MLEKIDRRFGNYFKIGAAILFVVGFFHFFFTLIMHNILESRDDSFYGQFFLSFKYLSVWVNAAVVVYCILRCIMIPIQIFKGTFFEEEEDEGKFESVLSKVIVYLQVSIVYPFGMLAFTLFWSLYLLNPAFVIRRCEEDALEIPVYLRHMMHTNLLIFIFLDLILTKRKYPQDYYCLAIIVAAAAVFIAWIHIVYAATSKWPHWLLGKLSLGLRWLFFIGLFVPAPIFFYTAKLLDYILWRVFEEKEETEETSKK